MAEVHLPDDWCEIQWHRAPVSRCYTRAKAERRVRWLNSHEHSADHWLFQVGGQDADGRWWLERRWIGSGLGALGGS